MQVKILTVAGASLPMYSEDGKTWHRQSTKPVPTAEPWPTMQCITSTITGRAQSPVRLPARVVARKKWGPHSLGRKPESVNMLKLYKDKEAARRRVEASQPQDCELVWLEPKRWHSPALSNPDKSTGNFALMGRFLLPPQGEPDRTIK